MKTLLLLLLLTLPLSAQEFPTRWDELTASDWAKAQEKAAYTCILPIGILEKHGPHVPMGSDLIQVREWSARATQKEYAIVFPIISTGKFTRRSINLALLPCLRELCGICWIRRAKRMRQTGSNGY